MIKKDDLWDECSFHDNVKNQISKICTKLGYDVREEYKGKDWRADVLVLANEKNTHLKYKSVNRIYKSH